MITRLNQILRQFRDAGTSPLEPEAIVAACRQVGYTAWRDRLLNPVATIQVFLLQVLHGHTACAHLPHLAGLSFTASAFCKVAVVEQSGPTWSSNPGPPGSPQHNR